VTAPEGIRLRHLGRLLGGLLRPPWSTGPWTLRRLAALIVFVPAFLLLQALHWIGLLLDEVLFRGYRDVEVTEPLFVVGLPRSGTSFVQRALADDDRFTTLRLWELLLAPSVTERKAWLALGTVDGWLGRPLGRLVRAFEGVAFRWMDEVHPVSLDAPEEDYFLLLPIFACFLLVVPFPYHSALWKLTRFDRLPAAERSSILAFYGACVQRHLYVVGPEKRLLSKNPSFTSMVGSLARAFPDARFLCCVRDPLRAVPSLLSSMRTGAAIFGWDPADPPLRDRFVEMMEGYADHAVATLDELPEDRRAFLPLGRLREDLEGRVSALYRRFGWELPDAFRDALRRRAERARSHRSRHGYSLDEFGLEPGDLSSRFRPLLRRFEEEGWGAGSSARGPGAPEGA